MRTPAGLSFLSACLTKKIRPFPVWLDHAAVGCAISGFSPRRYSARLDVATGSSPNQKNFLEKRKALHHG